MKFDLAEMRERSKTSLSKARLQQLQKSKSAETKELLGHIAWQEYLLAKMAWKFEKFEKRLGGHL